MWKKENVDSVYNKLKELDSSLPKENRERDNKKLKFCFDILTSMKNSFEEWNDICQYCVRFYSKYISEKYIENDRVSDEMYLTCGMFLREYIFPNENKNIDFGDGDFIKFTRSVQYTNNVLFKFNKFWSEFEKESRGIIDSKNNHNLDKLLNGKFDINIISYQLMLDKIKINESENKLKEKQESIDEFLKGKQNEVNILAEQLKEQKTAFNFVGLSKGFENILSKKISAKWCSFGIMSTFFIILSALPAAFIGGRFFGLFCEYNIKWDEIGWEQMLPVLGLELIFIYFFRVVLTHYNSVQTQIMQIELRQSLCQFIQSYAEYAKEIKEKDGISLEKFENLIFSSILSTPDKVPSTFDGIEQLSNLIKNIKSGS
ncbi:hypothetical protein BKG94_04435 [Rodentibacter ratti]|uniref:hypothetical protein n=1 Tax=Rodentibacter ratti TaxID=1906745 RepID=UPI000985F97F|nr:hypothetical protein [Rodentibacter ratti]OOF88831.1 hypothetical protein BKG94_04435 [Rodentibacter ratti]